MPNIKNPPREEPATQVDPNSHATERATNEVKLAPELTDTEAGVLGWLTTNAEGCTVRFGIEQQQYRLAPTLPNYNAMFSQLLVCWVQRWKVFLTYRKPLTSPTALAPTTPVPLNIVSIAALPLSATGD